MRNKVFYLVVGLIAVMLSSTVYAEVDQSIIDIGNEPTVRKKAKSKPRPKVVKKRQTVKKQKSVSTTNPEDSCVAGDCVNGYGTRTTPYGVAYIGEFKNNQFNGQGTLTLPNGIVSVGQFKDGQLNGQGTTTSDGMVVQKGKYRNGIFVCGFARYVQSPLCY